LATQMKYANEENDVATYLSNYKQQCDF
jgi:hypothetical protein